MASAPVIVWFRRDLRLADNPALHAAAQAGAPVIPLYIHDEDEAAGAASQWWLHHALAALDAPIATRKGEASAVLDAVIRETGATAVYWNRVYEPAAIARDTAIKAHLKACGIGAHSFKGNVLFEPWTVKPYKVFTPFYKACLAMEGAIGPALPAPRKTAWHGLASEALDLLPRIGWDRGFHGAWEPGEAGAVARARHFIEDIMPAYAVQRDMPADDGTSRLSPHLHRGDISVRELWHMAQPHTGSAAFLRELAWREFSIHLLYHNPSLSEQPLQAKFAAFPWRPDAAHLKAWQRGMTGYPIVDAGMRQLWQTGWMHNRVRMVAGSFLVKHLLQPWQDGQAWFMDTLVDADLANNAASWQWIAGCGADAAPYFRVFNPILQGEKFDPHGHYVRRFVPELRDMPDKYIHKPWLAGAGMAPDYPAPVVDHAAGRARALEAFGKLKDNKA